MQPRDLTRKHIEEWINQRVITQERTFWSAWEAAASFTAMLLRNSYTNVDIIAAARLDNYGKPRNRFPLSLQREVEALITYRANPADGSQDPPKDEDDMSDLDDGEDIADDTPLKRKQVRDITARVLEGCICRLYGFLWEKKRYVQRLDQLFEPKSFNRYKEYLLNPRVITPTALRTHFEPLVSAAHQYPALERRRSWLRNFMKQIPNEPEWQRRKRMASKCLEWRDLQAIPDKIQNERIALAQNSAADKKSVARLAMSEFLMRWLLVLPWRSRNICECRLDRNLFKHPVGAYSELSEEPCVRMALNGQEFWQYKFSKEECKGKYAIHRLLPCELVDPLKEYLELRDDLVSDAKERALFLNTAGRRLSSTELYCLISEITLRHGGKRASAKVLRDMYAFRYLTTNLQPSRFDDLAQILWHQQTATTRKYYATKLTLSAGAPLAEAYLKERRLLREAGRRIQDMDQSGFGFPEPILRLVLNSVAVYILIIAVIFGCVVAVELLSR